MSNDKLVSPRKRTNVCGDSGSQGDSFESPIKSRLASSFWKKSKPETSQCPNDSAPEVISIRDVKNGIIDTKAIIFRVSLMGYLKKSDSKYLKFHALDSTGEIAVVVYDNAEKFANILKLNGVYKLEKFDVRNEAYEYPQHTGIQLQVKLLSESVITEVSSEDIPKIPFNFIKIEDIFTEKYDVNERIDLLGVIIEDWGIETTRNGRKKRDIKITDETKHEVLLTLWGDMAENFVGGLGMSIALRKALIKTYQDNRLLNASGYSLVWVNPDLENDAALSLETWFREEVEAMKSS